MEATEIRRALAALLDDSGADWREAAGCLCFRLRRGGALLELACRPLDGRLLVYGRYPFPAGDRQRALARCSEVNGRVLQGAMFLDGGRVVFRTEAALPDDYEAPLRMQEAIAYNADVLLHFWGRLAPDGANL